MGLKPKEIPEKPEALDLFQQCQMMGIPLVEGGVLDQPHIWAREYRIVYQEKNRFERLADQARAKDAEALQTRKQS